MSGGKHEVKKKTILGSRPFEYTKESFRNWVANPYKQSGLPFIVWFTKCSYEFDVICKSSIFIKRFIVAGCNNI